MTRRAFLAAPSAVMPLASARAQSGIEALFAPRARAWERWRAHAAGSAMPVDHAAFGRFLAAHVVAQPDGSTRVAYRRVAPEGRQALLAYLGALAAVPVGRLDRAEQFAFWCNLYNALTLRVVLDRYPVRSIRDIGLGGGGLFGGGPWDATLVTVEGVGLTLNDIEHRILRPLWRDSRVHYAVNCASIGCPDLLAEPFTGARLDAQLDAAARRHVTHPRGAAATPDGLLLSSIYNWFADDFGGRDGVLRHIAAFGGPTGGRVAGYRYDWALNDAA